MIDTAHSEMIDVHNQKKILILDDDPGIVRLLLRLLEKMGFQANAVHTGEELIHLYNESLKCRTPFDLVILDLIVPGKLGGEKTMKKLLEINPEVKVIISSAHIFNPIMENYHEYGFQAKLPKPYSIIRLQHTINQVFPDTALTIVH